MGLGFRGFGFRGKVPEEGEAPIPSAYSLDKQVQGVGFRVENRVQGIMHVSQSSILIVKALLLMESMPRGRNDPRVSLISATFCILVHKPLKPLNRNGLQAYIPKRLTLQTLIVPQFNPARSTHP